MNNVSIMQTIGPNILRNSINNYYNSNPDTLMPLLMLALASQGKLFVRWTTSKNEETTFASIDIDEVMPYDWVKHNISLKNKLNKAKAKGYNALCVIGKMPAELKMIYYIFNHYDTVTVVQEYHHRKGLLVHHSSHAESDKAQRQYATICMAEQFASAPELYLQKNFLYIANELLELSGIQPKRPRIEVADALNALLKYDGQGFVYNPFAGCAFAGAMLGAGDKLYADGDVNEKLLAVSRLLCYGTGQRGYNIEVRDSSRWINGVVPDYIISTFLGYLNGQSAFDFCLSHCLDTFEGTGKYAGIVSPKEICERQSPLFKEAVRRNWIETIVLLPFGEMAVLVNANKPKWMRKHVRFVDMNHPWLSNLSVAELLDDDVVCSYIKNSYILKKGFMQSLVLPPEEEKIGYKPVRLGHYLKKLPKFTYNMDNVAEADRVLAYIDRADSYEPDGLKRKRVAQIFAPAYRLTSDCLITNSSGYLEPRVFEHYGNAFFQDGYAYEINVDFKDRDARNKWLNWLIDELNDGYVSRQLHPYGMNEMVPEPISEDAILNLVLYERMEDDEVAMTRSLPEGTILSDENTDYTIEKYLGHGSFGYTYKATIQDKSNGDVRFVVLKEFFPWSHSDREGLVAVIDKEKYDGEKENFAKEAEIMNKLGNAPDSHIAPAYGYFESKDTETSYYLMPFYSKGSFDDLCKSGYSFSEGMLIRDVAVPLCKALSLAHKERVLHLDIKPENIMLGEDGKAVLIDFGVSRKYDSEGHLLNRWGKMSCSEFAAPEMKIWQDENNEQINVGRTERIVNFDPRPDIFGLAASLYYMATRKKASPITYNSTEDKPIRKSLKDAHYSDQFANAIVSALQFAPPSRPEDAQAFLNMFPGCENIKL